MPKISHVKFNKYVKEIGKVLPEVYKTGWNEKSLYDQGDMGKWPQAVMFIDQLIDPEMKKPAMGAGFEGNFRGLDGTRTRDLRRDRAAF